MHGASVTTQDYLRHTVHIHYCRRHPIVLGLTHTDRFLCGVDGNLEGQRVVITGSMRILRMCRQRHHGGRAKRHGETRRSHDCSEHVPAAKVSTACSLSIGMLLMAGSSEVLAISSLFIASST